MVNSVSDIPLHKVSKAFLGTEEITDRIIITPLSGIYKDIKGRYDAKERCNCWWDNFTYETKDKREVMVVNSHQGNTIVDPILMTNDNCNYLMFLGFCGGFHPRMNIGDITIATDSYFENKNKIFRPKMDLSKLKPIFPDSIDGRNLTVESVIRETIAVKSNKPGYLKKGTVSVDQETAFIFKESKSQAASVMVVSDLPLKKTVFELSEAEEKQINNGIKKLNDGVLRFIDTI